MFSLFLDRDAFVELGCPVSYKTSSGYIGNKMAELFENHCDLLWSLKRSITESFKAIEGIREKGITLKWNKKLSIADIVIPAFTRICFTDPSSIGENVRRLLFRTYLGVRTCDIFLCFVSSCWGWILFNGLLVLLFSLFYVILSRSFKIYKLFLNLFLL